MKNNTIGRRLLILTIAVLMSISTITIVNSEITFSEITTYETNYISGSTNVDLDFQLHAISMDLEGVEYAEMHFPTGITVNSATDIDSGDGWEYLTWNAETGDGVTTTWGLYAEYILNQDVDFSVNVDIDPSFSGDLIINWELWGDGWGAPPNYASGAINIPQAPSSCTILPLYDSDAEACDADGTDATAVLGSGCWMATPGVDTNADTYDKFEIYFYWKDSGILTEPILGTFTIDEIDHIIYHTNKPLDGTNPDFYLLVYTEPDTVDDYGWYGYRLNAEPYFSNNLNAPASQWNQWTTDDTTNQLTFFDSWKTGTYGFYGQPDLQDLQAGTINWQTDYGYGTNQDIDYGAETVMGLCLSTGSAWSGTFDGYLDAIEVKLTDGTCVILDLENKLDTAYVDDDWVSNSPGDIVDGHIYGFDAFSTIQEAVDAVTGSTVYIAAGTYTESVTFPQGCDLTIIGESRDTVTWIANPTFCGLCSLSGYTGTTSFDISGITFNCRPSASSTWGVGLEIYRASSGPLYLDVHDCRFIEDRASGDSTHWGTSMLLCHNRFASRSPDAPVKIHDNIDETWGGLTMSNSQGYDIYDNVFDGCSDAIYCGHGCPDAAGNTFGDHHIFDNEFKHAISTLHPSGLTPAIDIQYYGGGGGTHLPITIEHNLFEDNDDAIRFVMDTDMMYPAHSVQYNNFIGNDMAIRVQGTFVSDLDATCNWYDDISGPSGNGPGTGDAVTANVDFLPWLNGPYPSGDCVGGLNVHNTVQDTWWPTIQDALDNADPYDILEANPGVYEEIITIDFPITILGASHGVCKKGYSVPAGYIWDDTTESIIQPPVGFEDDLLIHIYDTDDVTFDGFIVQALERGSSGNRMLMHVEAQTQNMENIHIINNIIGPNTNLASQDGNKGRMNLDLDLNPYDATIGITDSTIACNKIFDSLGNGDNIFIWGSYHAYGATGPSPMTNTFIEDNEICGAHRCGIETAGGHTGLTIRNNDIHSNSGNPGDTPYLKYGTGILMIRGSSDKVDCNGYGPDNLLIQNNNIYNNEKHGIYMGPKNNQVEILENNIYDNGDDGIQVDLIGNYWNPDYEPSPGPYTCLGGTTDVIAHCNIIENNLGYGAQVIGTPSNGFILDATCNWWNDCSGPAGVGPGTGDAVSINVEYDPWIGSITADAGGPYVAEYDDDYYVQFYSHGTSTPDCCDEIITEFFWDFGDGETSTEEHPNHQYHRTVEMEYTVTLTVTTITLGETCSAMDTTTVIVDPSSDDSQPIVQLVYPKGGEIISGTIIIDWYAIDSDYPVGSINLPIYLYYHSVGSSSWTRIDGPLLNDGEYSWDTSRLGDGEYEVKVEAVDEINNALAADQSDPFTIDNANAGVRISNVLITDTSIDSSRWLKNGDNVEITAAITGMEAGALTTEDITADLSSFGGAQTVSADSYDGFMATWTLENVICSVADGELQVIVSIDGDSRTGVINADNTAPEVHIEQSLGGIYLFNTRIAPFSKTIIFGSCQMLPDILEEGDIATVEYSVDEVLLFSSVDEPYSWLCNIRSMGASHQLAIDVTDGAGNSEQITFAFTLMNPFGIDW